MKRMHFSGSITLFLCLTLTIMISLIMLTIESARIQAVKAYTEGISRLALESALGYFSLPLYENYGLFAISQAQTNVDSVTRKYVDDNLTDSVFFPIASHQVKPDLYYHLTDKNGTIFLSQVLEYMSGLSLPFSFYCLYSGDSFDSLGKSYADISSIDLDDEEYLDNQYPLEDFSNDMPDSSDISDEEDAKSLKKGLLGSVSELQQNVTLSLYLPENQKVSAAAITPDLLPSKTCHYQNTQPSKLKAFSDKSRYLLYLYLHFPCYTNQVSSQGLSYMCEYILYGNNRDSENLSAFLSDLQALRTGLNLAYLYTDTAKRSEARTLAMASTAMIEIPFLTEFTQFAILSAWAYAEAVTDIRGLVRGKKIPLVKKSDSWNLDLSGILSLSSDNYNKGSDYGFSYEQYLLLYLYKNLDTRMIYRTMDMIQAALYTSENNLLLSECITGLTYDFSFLYHPFFYIRNPLYTENTYFSHKFTQSLGY